jgi:4-amino-4-deoxy-L-arabinose transferase-like glycosyltransferase
MRNRLNLSLSAKVVLLVVVIYFPYFLHLGDLPIHAWDEARLVANASEMIENGNYLVTHFHGNPEMWNTKPPLMIWSQVFFVKLMGNQELSYRMPSALAGFLTCLLIVFLTVRYLKSFWYGFMAALVLVTSEGHLGGHVARTGDYDALLTLFMIAYLMFFFIWTETGKTKYLHLFFVAIVLSVYTKSVQGLFFLPAVFSYIFIAGKGKTFFKQKWVYIDALLSIIIIGAYYLARESVNPGYLEAVYENELGGRLLNTIEKHKGTYTYYLDLLIGKQFKYYIILALMGFFTSFAFQDKVIRRFIRYVALSALLYLLIITLAQTKLAWYTAPVIPTLAILAAAPVYLILNMITGRTDFKPLKHLLIQVIFLIIVFGYPYYLTIDNVYKPKEKPESFHFTLISHLLQDGFKGKTDLNGVKILYPEYRVQLEYYINQMRKKGIDISLAELNMVKPGNKVITVFGKDKNDILSKFNTTEMLSYYHINIYRIDSVK